MDYAKIISEIRGISARTGCDWGFSDYRDVGDVIVHIGNTNRKGMIGYIREQSPGDKYWPSGIGVVWFATSIPDYEVLNEVIYESYTPDWFSDNTMQLFKEIGPYKIPYSVRGCLQPVTEPEEGEESPLDLVTESVDWGNLISTSFDPSTGTFSSSEAPEEPQERRFIVWAPQGRTNPKKVHKSLEEAQEVAQIMTVRHGHVFFVCEVVEAYKPKTVAEKGDITNANYYK